MRNRFARYGIRNLNGSLARDRLARCRNRRVFGMLRDAVDDFVEGAVAATSDYLPNACVHCILRETFGIAGAGG